MAKLKLITHILVFEAEVELEAQNVSYRKEGGKLGIALGTLQSHKSVDSNSCHIGKVLLAYLQFLTPGFYV